jgi:hypothetical protein
LQVDEILEEFQIVNSSLDSGNLDDILHMKLTSVQNLCPALSVGVSAAKLKKGEIAERQI